jgi:PKD repeat protein
MRRPSSPSRISASRRLALALAVALAVGCGDDASDRTPNSPPTARFTVSPASGTTATVFRADASTSSDGEDPASALEVRWDWEGDGTWDTALDTTKTAEHQYMTAGGKTIRLEVIDTGGLTGTATRQVTVETPGNTAPEASFTVAPTSGTTETLFTVDASSSADIEDPVSALEARWDWQDDGTWDTAYDTTKTSEHRYDAAGRKTIRLEVRDSGGLTGTTTRTVDLPSAPPQDMAFIPAGPFTMGSDPGEGYLDEQPEHAPWISAFYMDLREVTNARYAGALNWAMPQGLIEVAAGRICTWTASRMRAISAGSPTEAACSGWRRGGRIIRSWA